jgi:integrase
LKRSTPTRHHPALKHEAVPAFMARLRRRRSITSYALEFLILTATRSGEVRGARWTEIDFAARVWVIPPARMKTAVEHRVPLTDRALAILRELAAVRLGELIFPGARRGEPLHGNTLRMALGTLEKGITCHGFRSSFRDWAGEETDYPHDICEAALSHTRRDKTHSAYQRGDLLAKRRKLMEAWGQFCEPSRIPSPSQQAQKTPKTRARARIPA